MQMARDRQLSPEQEAVFLLRLLEERDYEAIAHQLQISPSTCLKRMGEVYKKFGIQGATKGKENRLRTFLIERVEEQESRDEPMRLPRSAERYSDRANLLAPLPTQEGEALQNRRVLISCRWQEPDFSVAQELQAALQPGGYEVFLVQEDVEQGEKGWQCIKAQLRLCDYWLFMWSPQSIYSEAAIAIIEQAKELRSRHNKPEILAICIDYALLSLLLNCELRDSLEGIPQLEWRSPTDTSMLVQAVLNLVTGNESERGAALVEEQVCIEEVIIQQLPPALPPAIFYSESDPQPMADSTRKFRWIVTIQENLELLFAHKPDAFVAGDLLWYPVEAERKTCQAPNVMVVLGRPKGDRSFYKQWEEENIAPQVVFEILSPGNRLQGLAQKFKFYERYGVEEYYIYDPDGAELVGWLRSGKELEVIEQIEGWVSPRIGIKFQRIADDLEILLPSGERFFTFVELGQLRERERQRAEAAIAQLERERERNQMLEALLRQRRIKLEEF